MKNASLVGGTVFVIMLLLFGVQWIYLYHKGVQMPILCLEWAGREKGSELLQSWYATHVGTHNLIYHALWNTWMDFPFIFSWTVLLFTISYTLMQRESNGLLNNLLRFGFLLAIVAALMDLVENGILLFDLWDYAPAQNYVSTFWFSLVKWLCIASILIFWMASIVKRRFMVKTGGSLRS